MGAKRRLSLDSVKAITNDVTSCVLFFGGVYRFWVGGGGAGLWFELNI